jgi:hypothetical protein
MYKFTSILSEQETFTPPHPHVVWFDMESNDGNNADSPFQKNNRLFRAIKNHNLLLLFGIWSTVTGLALLRIHRQPYVCSMKAGEYETVIKGTSLAAVLAAIASGSFRRSSQDPNRE